MYLDAAKVDEVHNVLVAPFEYRIDGFDVLFLGAVEAALGRFGIAGSSFGRFCFANSHDALVEDFVLFEESAAEALVAIGEAAFFNEGEEPLAWSQDFDTLLFDVLDCARRVNGRIAVHRLERDACHASEFKDDIAVLASRVSHFDRASVFGHAALQ